MKLSTKSWHYKLYLLAYGNHQDYLYSIRNLCPYFWKIVWALLIFIPMQLLILPSYTFKVARVEIREEGYLRPLNIIMGVFSYSMFAIIFYMIYGTFFCKVGTSPFTAGVICWLLFLGVIIAYVWENINSNKSSKEKKPNIFIEFIKAKYNRYCPTIEWENE